MLNTTKFKLAILMIGFFTLINTSNALAIGKTDWSWTSEKPEIVNSIASNVSEFDDCPTIRRPIEISGRIGEVDACVYGDNLTSFAEYWESGQGLRNAVSLPMDSKMYKANIGCSIYDTCLYLSGSDTLVMRRYFTTSHIGTLVIYKNFTSRLKPVLRGLFKEYDFDNSLPDYESYVEGVEGKDWLINGFTASSNGKWLVTEVFNTGWALINIETLNIKQISNSHFRYWVGFNPLPELAVSNDGRHVAITGLNAGFTFIDVDDECGGDLFGRSIDIEKPCSEYHFPTNELVDRFFIGHKPRFNEDGSELSAYVQSYLGETKEILLRAANSPEYKLKYLALGDSFTSGEGEIDDSYYLPRTNDEFEKCHLSSRSYPFLLANLQNIDSDLMRSVACSGATTSDVVVSNSQYLGQHGRLGLGENKMNLSPSEISVAKQQAKLEFIPGRISQNIFSEKYKPDQITIGIGGNDAGLMNKLAACVSPGTCEWASDLTKKEQVAKEIQGVFKKLVKTYQDINTSSPKSKIYAIGYPKIISLDGKCNLASGAMFTDEEKVFIDESIAYLNDVVEAAAKRAGIGYINIEDSFGDHVLCGNEDPIVMNDIKFGDDFKYAWVVGVGNESFHPNPTGHEYIAKEISRQIDSNYCADDTNFCPNNDTQAPEPSAYWVPGDWHINPTLVNGLFLQQANDSQLNIKIDNYFLEPNSKVSVEIHSDTISLGDFEVDGSGALNTTIQLPDSLEYGYHTVFIKGYSYSGEAIELYQVINHVDVTEKIKIEVPELNIPEFNIPIKTPDNVSESSVKTEAIENSASNNGKESAVIAYSNQPKEDGEIKGDYDMIASIDETPVLSGEVKNESYYLIVPVLALAFIVAGFIIYKKISK